MIGNLVGVLFDGIAYGSLLFIIAVGLSVTLGLMNFVNLAHGAFAMVGGYVCVVMMTRLGVPFLATLPRGVHRRRASSASSSSGRSTSGSTSPATSTRCCSRSAWCSCRSPSRPISSARRSSRSRCRRICAGRCISPGVDFGVYRIFLIVVVAALTLALQYIIERTRFGSQVRASVDNATAAAGLGINVNRVFALTFALGSGLAGLGGGLGIDVLGLDPTFPLKYMVYFLLVVAVGGAGTIKGPLVAALILGVFDVAGKYYFPKSAASSSTR